MTTAEPGLFAKERRNILDTRLLDAATENDHPLRIAQEMRAQCAHWIDSYYAFLTIFLSRGYEIKPINEFDVDDCEKKILYLRHDIHRVDIPGALCMMDVERKLGLRTTYYVMWNYRKSDRENDAQYRLLKKFGGDDFEYGLHECAFDTYLFRNYLDGGEQPDDTKAEATRILTESGLKDLKPEQFFEKDNDGIFRYPAPASIESDEFRAWIVGAKEILHEYLESMRENFGACDTIHAHGGYVTVAMRNFFDLPGTYEFFEKTMNATIPGMYMLSQTFRICNHEDRERMQIKGFVYDYVNQLYNRLKTPQIDIRDSYQRSSAELLTMADGNVSRGTACFALLHPSVWASQHYNGLSDALLDRIDTKTTSLPAGLSRYSVYKTKLMRAAKTRFAKLHGDDWQDDNDVVTTYGYGIGNVEDRAKRVIALLEHCGLLHRLNGASMADLGGGTGTVSGYIATHFDIKRLYVMDIEEEMLDFQKALYSDLGWSHLTFEQSEFARWPGLTEPADFIMSYGAFEFFYRNRDINWIFGKVGDSVAPGGMFVANVWNHHFRNQGYSRAPNVQYLPTQWLRVFAARRLGYHPNVYFRSLSHRRWRRELAKAGFTQVDLFYCRQHRGKFLFEPITKDDAGTLSHIWVLAQK